MGRATFAVAISLLIHVILAAALVAYLEYAPAPDVLATLDLSSVELSFAEDETPTAAAVPVPPPPESVPPPQPPQEPPPNALRPDAPLPPDPSAPALREPESRPRPVETPRRAAPPTATPPERTPPPPAAAPPSSATAPRQAKVDAPPRPKRTIRPDYPKGARQRGEQGDVVVELRVNAFGVVDEVRIVASSGFPELDAAATKAVRTAKFTPARSGHEDVASTARLTLTFRLK